MAHFAELDENNKVLRVLVVDNAHEDRGDEFLAVDCGLGGFKHPTTPTSEESLLVLVIPTTRLTMSSYPQNLY
jgi:hypothetical protein